MLSVLAVSLVTLLHSDPAAAQLTFSRTWVSGAGSDANACTRAAPCLTFATAISKTLTGGEINCLDSGGFGSVDITKSISIRCVGVTAGMLVAPGDVGIFVNAPAGSEVLLEGLDIEGQGTGPERCQHPQRHQSHHSELLDPQLHRKRCRSF